MLIIPGQIIAALTFPGVIVHEIAHQLVCRLLKVPVLKVCYFQFENPSGYVVHESPREAYKSLLIGIGPFIFNTLVGGLIASGGAISVIKFNAGNWMDFLLIWLGVSIAMHAFPSMGDAKQIWDVIKRKDTHIGLKILGIPIVLAIYAGAALSVIWFDVIYGISVAMLLPNFLIRFFA
jgi:hypothetical protein